MTPNFTRGSTEVPVDLYVSPHLDDAALSCGGRIAASSREAREVVVVSVFTAPAPDHVPSTHPLVRGYHELTGADRDPLLRQREDREALAMLGARPVHLEYLDCIYRTGADGLPLVAKEPDIFRFGDPAEQELLRPVGESLRALVVELRAARVVLPLALGGHRDHVFVRQAGDIAGRRLVDAVDVLYFEDVPYVVAEPEELPKATVGMGPEVFPLTSGELDARLDAIRRYRSQLPILWHEGDGLFPMIRDYAHLVGGGAPGERYWRPAPGET